MHSLINPKCERSTSWKTTVSTAERPSRERLIPSLGKTAITKKATGLVHPVVLRTSTGPVPMTIKGDFMASKPSGNHLLKRVLTVCAAILVVLFAFFIFKGSSFARSFRGAFLAKSGDFSLAYTYTSGIGDTYYLMFSSNSNMVCLTSSASKVACIASFQGTSLKTGVDSVFYYSDGACHRNFKYQDPSDSSLLTVTETEGGKTAKTYSFTQADIEAATTALTEMTAVYDISKP